MLLPVSLCFPHAVSSNSSVAGVVGVTYAMNTPGLPHPKKVVEALVAAGVTRVLLVDPYPDGVAAFNNTDIVLTIAINNSYIQSLATNVTMTFLWLGDNIILPNIKIEAISVGYDVFSSENLHLAGDLLQAIQNLHEGMSEILQGNISITTANSFDLITPAFPPSAAEFNRSVAELYLRPLLQFLDGAGFPFFISLYPFKLYRAGQHLTDPKTGLVYYNIFDAMVDATVAAMAKLGYADVPLVVSGTGWPSEGGLNEPEASILYAGEYNEGLVSKLNMRLGTPARPETTPVTFIYALFDDPRETGAESERNWGIWTMDMQQKYVIDFTPSKASGGRTTSSLHRSAVAAVTAFVLLCLA
ncbi:unnamed protein product [Spirodela intermedia]|uniref:Uncharacterized protein n=1 Tax=Spirodela intermedia TaxID=51605 RepID=A0A7I8IGY8_SPIIN|nr:unnamed protein product [Spirodela intermedia]CAA6656757.1 unnamed protein product [Spirodela intermedia]